MVIHFDGEVDSTSMYLQAISKTWVLTELSRRVKFQLVKSYRAWIGGGSSLR
jgi:hypothetical protein